LNDLERTLAVCRSLAATELSASQFPMSSIELAYVRQVLVRVSVVADRVERRRQPQAAATETDAELHAWTATLCTVYHSKQAVDL